MRRRRRLPGTKGVDSPHTPTGWMGKLRTQTAQCCLPAGVGVCASARQGSSQVWGVAGHSGQDAPPTLSDRRPLRHRAACSPGGDVGVCLLQAGRLTAFVFQSPQLFCLTEQTPPLGGAQRRPCAPASPPEGPFAAVKGHWGHGQPPGAGASHQEARRAVRPDDQPLCVASQPGTPAPRAGHPHPQSVQGPAPCPPLRLPVEPHWSSRCTVGVHAALSCSSVLPGPAHGARHARSTPVLAAPWALTFAPPGPLSPFPSECLRGWGSGLGATLAGRRFLLFCSGAPVPAELIKCNYGARSGNL